MTAAEIVTLPIVLHVYGVPQPQGNKTGFYNKNTGRVSMVEGRRPKSRAEFKSWREGVTTAARDWQEAHGGILPLDVPLQVDITFWLPRPKSAPKRRIWPDRSPDIDKLARAVLDGITGVLVTDDARVVELLARKRYATDCAPGAKITIEAFA